jgi:hypothetical protein
MPTLRGARTIAAWKELAGPAVSRLPVPGGGPVAMNRRSDTRAPCTVAMRISINECIHVGSVPHSVIHVRTTRIRVSRPEDKAGATRPAIPFARCLAGFRMELTAKRNDAGRRFMLVVPTRSEASLGRTPDHDLPGRCSSFALPWLR